MPIDAVIFDIGNVLLKFDYFIAANRLLASTGRKEYPDRERITALVLAYESGSLARQEFIALVRGQFLHEGGDEEFLRIWEDIFEPNTPMIDLLPRFAAKRRLFLLSNMGCIHQEFIFRRYDFFSHFEDGIFSYRAGCLKPHPKIFRLAHETFSVVPQRTLYIDDVAENVKAAGECGFLTLHYDHKEHGKFEEELTRRKIHPRVS